MMQNNDLDASGGGRKIAMKFLVSNIQAGSLIGKGGKAIKELVAVTGARVTVSASQEVFPGTSDRVALITGTKDACSMAQTLIWEMISQLVKSAGEDKRDLDWSPEACINTLGANDNIQVTAKITIPAAAGGLILGKGGESVRSICAESGARLIMTSKEEALFTQERVITIYGEAGQCIKAGNLVLAKLAGQEEMSTFVNKGTSYGQSYPMRNTYGNQPMGAPMGQGQGRGQGANQGMYGQNGGGTKRSLDQGTHGGGGYVANEVDFAQTTITIAIPNDYVGQILGKQGATLREITALSGAKVIVSGKNEFIEGTNNRLVTITGSPQCAQAAHMYITQRLEQPSNPPHRKPRQDFS
jgi:RNA-binding protein Nova